MPDELEQNNVDNTALVQQLEDLTSVINTQLELEQQQKEEQALQEKEVQKKLEKQLKEEEQLRIEQEEQELLLQEQKEQESKEFQESVLQSISDLNTNDSSTMLEQQAIIIEQQALIIEMYEEVFPSLKQSSDLSIFYLVLIPLFFIVRWLGQMIASAIR